MSRKMSRYSSPRKQRGSMLIIAIFVIVVLGGLAIAMTEMQQDDAQSMVFEVYGARAFNAANSGLQQSVSEVLNAKVCSLPQPLDLSSNTAFSGCNVTSTCESFDIAVTGFKHFNIISTANCSAGDFTTQRRVQVQARVRN